MKKTSTDNIYQSPQPASPFKFDARVAAVFPDMIQRSVPGYDTIIEGIQSLSQRFVKANTHCYDLGCSLGAASLAMSRGIQADGCKVIGVDNSPSMIERSQLFIDAYRHHTPVELVCGDLQEIPLTNASMVVLNFTLQFISVDNRDAIIKKIVDGLNPGGVLILSEKIKASDDAIDNTLIDLHHDFKRANGYSELEISQKRNALENVLLPETIETHSERLLGMGFKSVDVWFKHFNFCSMMAFK
ncbi:carboxy-S-adenosyl-L-methionine synthase CmoA [Pleionea sp. CnH1-48]|uniref:carboxy-S-adenosyl-L-methionine synthase CmoA n=1 Tax=Pleionea sp. CnH1-48 TaxID=2954494 RepID=UPI002097A6D7|nr:carboxy-S-adenosyl-L-methionine synthase CmoA [Pleionea sp. CnH1-48]MCO7226936.1 carboxy-S-adenosyl-L-methionine synthase CmoA [Pleionea sp. CnH1-48]